MFDQGKTGFIETNRVAAILNTMGQQFDNGELQIMIEQADKESKLQANHCKPSLSQPTRNDDWLLNILAVTI